MKTKYAVGIVLIAIMSLTACSRQDVKLSKQAAGTWTSKGDGRDGTMTLSPDGSFSLLDSTNKPSAGTWQIKDGVFIMTFTTAPDAGMVGIEYKCKIVRLDDHELIYAGRGHNIELKR